MRAASKEPQEAALAAQTPVVESALTEFSAS
jgi:hypothetical protein